MIALLFHSKETTIAQAKLFAQSLPRRVNGKPKELWFKIGHNRFFFGQLHPSGDLTLQASHVPEGKKSVDRVISDEVIQNGWAFLWNESHRKEGGVFWIPTQPESLPLAENVGSIAAAVIEADQGSTEFQLQQTQTFSEISGIDYWAQLSSGGKSVHSMLMFDRFLPLEQAFYLRALLIIAHLSDPVTIRPHQPVRYPGFHRLEKGAYQTLLLLNPEARYSFEEIVAGVKRFFDFKGWRFPDRITKEWWSGCIHNLLKASKEDEGLSDKEILQRRESRISTALEIGIDGWEDQQEQKRLEREYKALERANLKKLHGETWSDLIDRASVQLGATAFADADLNHQWESSRNKARVCCPFHDSKSGNSAWIAPARNGTGWIFACSACSNDKPISPFLYWLYRSNGDRWGVTYPQGRQFVEAAKGFCQWAGVIIPDNLLTSPGEPEPSEYASIVAEQRAQEHVENVEAEVERYDRLKRIGSNWKLPQFNQARAVETELSEPDQHKPQHIDEIFAPGGRLASYQAAMREGYKFILDASHTGAGKNYETGKYRPEDFSWTEIETDSEAGEQPVNFVQADRIIAISADARNQTTQTFNSHSLIPARHEGTYKDSKGKTRRIRDGIVSTTPANCTEMAVVEVFRSKNLDTTLVCEACPNKERCTLVIGMFKHDRRQAFENRLNVCHVLSLPDTAKHNYGKNILFFDEPGQSFVSNKQIAVTPRDLDQMIAHLATSAPELFGKLQPLLTTLRTEVTQEQPRYGKGHNQIKALLPAVPEINMSEVYNVTAPDFDAFVAPERLDRSALHAALDAEIAKVKEQCNVALKNLRHQEDLALAQFFVDKKQVKRQYKLKAGCLREQRDKSIKELKAKAAEQARGLQRSLNKATAPSQAERVAAIDQVVKQWLPDFLDVLTEREKGDLWIGTKRLGQAGKSECVKGLFITVRDDRLPDIAKSAKLSVFLDATLSREDLALKLGVSPDEIWVCKQEDAQTPNLKITQITDLGRMGASRGNGQERRLAEIFRHFKSIDPEMRTIDLKKFTKDDDASSGAWWRDSRGMNDYLTTRTLLLVGTPCANLSQLLAEYSCDTGEHPDQNNAGFKAWVDRKIKAEFVQGIGRLRAHRRLNENLHIVVISDFDLQMEGVEQIKASSICSEAATSIEQAWSAIKECIKRWFTRNGEMPTQAQVEAETGYKQSWISKLAAKFVGGWNQLEELVYSLINPPPIHPDTPPGQREQQRQAVEESFETIVNLPSLEIAERINYVIQEFGCKAWLKMVAIASYRSRLELVTALFKDRWVNGEFSVVV